MKINEQAILSAISPREQSKPEIVRLINLIQDSEDPVGSCVLALKTIIDFLEESRETKE